MPLERAGGRELAQLVPHHVLGDVHRDELLAVVHRDGVPHELRQNRRTPRPRPHHLLLVGGVQRVDLLFQVVVGKRPFFDGTPHVFTSSSLLPRHDPLVGALVVARLEPARRLAPRRHRDGGRRRSCPRRRRADDPPGSSTRRGCAASCPASACAPPCRAIRFRDPRCRPARCVAMQSTGTRRTSPDGSFSSARPPSLETSCACEPAERAICAPLPGCSSMLCTMVPAGNVLQRQRIADQDVGLRPGHHLLPHFQTVRRGGCSASRRPRSAAGRCAPSGWDRTRWPQPRRNTGLVALEIDHPVGLLVAAADEARSHPPVAVAPAGSLLGLDQRLLGCSLVMSSRETTVWKRRVGVVGLYVLIGIV